MAVLVYALILLAVTVLAGWGALRLLARGSLAAIGLGLLLLFACVILPFFLGYGWAYGTLAAVLGAVLAFVQRVGKVGWLARAGLVVAIAFISIGPAAWLFADNLQTAERIGRCWGEVAIRTIEADRAGEGRYPPDLHTVAVDSGPYESPSCPIYQGVNWLYHAGRTDYTFGYWNDWLLGKQVCLHTAGQQGWSCGLNQWGPFRPGETD
jgi:hypothetical protein